MYENQTKMPRIIEKKPKFKLNTIKLTLAFVLYITGLISGYFWCYKALEPLIK